MRTDYRLMHKLGWHGRYLKQELYPTREAAAQATPVTDLTRWRVGGDPEVRSAETTFGDSARRESWLIVPEQVPESVEDRIELAADLALEYGGYDGDHHKMWVIDQMLRVLLGDGYAAAIERYCDGEDGPDTYGWDEGTPP